MNFFREFQLWFLVAAQYIFGFILSMTSTEWQELPVAFWLTLVGGPALCWLYREIEPVIEKFTGYCHDCGKSIDVLNDPHYIDQNKKYVCENCMDEFINRPDLIKLSETATEKKTTDKSKDP